MLVMRVLFENGLYLFILVEEKIFSNLEKLRYTFENIDVLNLKANSMVV